MKIASARLTFAILLASGLSACISISGLPRHQLAAAATDAVPAGTTPDGMTQAAPPATIASGIPAIKVTGYVTSAIRPYDRVLPGIREYNVHRHLAPQTELRFGVVTDSFPMKPLTVSKAALEGRWGWSQELKVVEDGWMLIPDSPEAEQRKADLVVSRRNAASQNWVIDIHTPSLPPQVYRLGDLRLECRVYLAIEWAMWKGRLVMARRQSPALKRPPMDDLCNGNQEVFFNTRPWPGLQAYELKEGGRTWRVDLDRWQIASQSFMLQLGSSPEAWSDDALVEFHFYDSSHWGTAGDVVPAKTE